MIKIGALNFTFVEGEDIGVLTSDFKVDIDDTTYIVPEGEHWDGASIPPRAWGILKAHPFDRFHRRPSCYHDRAYSGAFFETKLRADYNYMRLLIAEKYPIHKAVVEFLALTFFGRSHWRGDSASRRSAKAPVIGAIVLAGLVGCQSTLDKTRNADFDGAIIDDGGFKAGTVTVQSVAQGESAILVDYSEDSSIFSPGQPMRHIKLTATGADYISVMPDIFAHLCDAFKAAKEAKKEE